VGTSQLVVGFGHTLFGVKTHVLWLETVIY